MEKYQQRREKCEELFQKGERKAAFYLMRSLAKDGDEIIYCELGNLYELGGDGIEIDYAKAKKWYEKSLEIAGDPWGAYALGRLYYNGNGVKQDYETAMYYFDLAEKTDLTIASLMLGRMYRYGFGTEKNNEIAIKYLTKASQKGFVYAIKNLGSVLIENGNHIRGIFLYAKGIISQLYITITKGKDERLRSS